VSTRPLLAGTAASVSLIFAVAQDNHEDARSFNPSERMLHGVDKQTGERASLHTTSEDETRPIVEAKNAAKASTGGKPCDGLVSIGSLAQGR
jgi:hypothetical protein